MNTLCVVSVVLSGMDTLCDVSVVLSGINTLCDVSIMALCCEVGIHCVSWHCAVRYEYIV